MHCPRAPNTTEPQFLLGFTDFRALLTQLKNCFLRGSQSIFGHGAGMAAKNPCRHSLSSFCFHLAARRYVRSTSAASRRESLACQTLIISSSLCLPLRPASRIKLQIPSSKAFPHPYIPPPGPARTAALRPQFALEASKCDF